MKKQTLLSFGLIILSLALLSGCGSRSKSAAGIYEAATVTETAAAFYNADTGAEAAEAEMGVKDSGLSGAAVTSDTAQSNTERKLIRTVNLSVETDDFDSLLDYLSSQISALNGYVEQSDISGNSIQSRNSRRRANLTLRIPNTELDHFVTAVGENGNITNKYETTTDVTLQYSDIESRKKSLTIEQERIWALLEKADTLEAVISLEERLSEIRYELESMESQLRLYDNQVDYSTVYIYIEEVQIYTPTAPATVGERIQTKLSKNIENIKDSAVDIFVFIISSAPYIVLLLVFLPILIFLVKKVHVFAFRRVSGIKNRKPFLNFKKDKHSDNASE